MFNSFISGCFVLSADPDVECSLCLNSKFKQYCNYKIKNALSNRIPSLFLPVLFIKNRKTHFYYMFLAYLAYIENNTDILTFYQKHLTHF